MGSPLIALTDAPEADELATIRRQLDRYNVQACGIDDQRPVAIILKDPTTQEVMGVAPA
jgi:hypothetical protein